MISHDDRPADTEPPLSPGEAPTRERLLAAADRLMYQRGYEAVGVADLCREAGAKKGSFYHFFPSKQALAIEMLERSWERTRRTIFAGAFDDDRLGAIDAFTRYGQLLAQNLARVADGGGPVLGCRFGNFASELATTDDEIRACVHRVFEAMTDIFEAVIARGEASGELPIHPNRRDRARHVLAHMEGLMVVAKSARDSSLLERLGPTVAQLLR